MIEVGDTVWPKSNSTVCRWGKRTVIAVYEHPTTGRWLWLIDPDYGSPETMHASVWTKLPQPTMTFINDPCRNCHELTLSQGNRINIAQALSQRMVVTRDGEKVLGRVVWGLRGVSVDTPGTGYIDGLGYEIHPDGSVHCSGGYQAVVDDGFIVGFRKEWDE